LPHRWGDRYADDPHNTFRTCVKCALVKVTRHEPGNFPEHWTEYERDGARFQSATVPPCEPDGVPQMSTKTETAATPAKPPIIYKTQPHQPGIVFGMDAETYHADPSLGSSSIKKLSKNPADWWFDSWMNPRQPGDKETPAKIRGQAVHDLVLYGETMFDSKFMRGAEHHDDMTAAEKGVATKAANAAAAKVGLTALNAEVYDNIAIAGAMIAKNKFLSVALTGGMNEVSVFWRETVDGIEIPLKARFDCLKIKGIGDLKSITNKFDKPFDRCCIDSIVNYRYDIQVKHYMDARALVAKFVADGKVFGDHDAAYLAKVSAAKQWAWQFVFWQAEGAPITDSLIISPGNPILEVAGQSVTKAKANYAAYMNELGTEQMWLLESAPRELFMEDLPIWYAR